MVVEAEVKETNKTTLRSERCGVLGRKGEYLPLVGDFMSFDEIVSTLNKQGGHNFSFKQLPKEVFAAASFPGAAELADSFVYFQAHTSLGSDSRDRIALANTIAGRQPTKFAAWAQVNVPT